MDWTGLLDRCLDWSRAVDLTSVSLLTANSCVGALERRNSLLYLYL
jgi:hypothetical protein